MTNSFLKYVLIASITPSSSGFLPTSLNMLWSPLRAHLYIFILIFLFYFFLLYNTALVLSYINMNPPQVYMSSQPWTPLPPPSPYHLSGSSQCTSPKHLVSCIEPRLAIRFLHDSIHVSMPFCQIIPPSPSPTESKSLFFISMSLLLSSFKTHRCPGVSPCDGILSDFGLGLGISKNLHGWF